MHLVKATTRRLIFFKSQLLLFISCRFIQENCKKNVRFRPRERFLDPPLLSILYMTIFIFQKINIHLGLDYAPQPFWAERCGHMSRPSAAASTGQGAERCGHMTNRKLPNVKFRGLNRLDTGQTFYSWPKFKISLLDTYEFWPAIKCLCSV